jgi:threonine synthase
MIGAVSDEQILAAYDLLASQEGVFVEPASAAGVAGLIANRDRLPVGPVVVTLTGHGLKDSDVAMESVEVGEPVPATLTAVREALGIGH